MTEPHDPDELASAYLDGAASAEETIQVESDPALLARVDELRAVRQALGELPPVDAARRDAAVDAALAAFDDDALATALRPATVTPLAPRRGLSAGAIKALSAAAVVLLLILVPLLLFDGSGDDDAASFDATGDAMEGAEDGGAGAETAEEAADTTVAAPSSGGTESNALSDVGSYEDLDALAAAVAFALTEDRTTDPAFTLSPDTARCVTDAPPGAETGAATMGGEPVEVLVTANSDGTRTLTVYDRTSCLVLGVRAL